MDGGYDEDKGVASKNRRMQKDCRMLQFIAARYLNKINAIIRAVTVR